MTTWYVSLDGTALDLRLGWRHESFWVPGRFNINLRQGTIKVAWREMLHIFLKRESYVMRSYEREDEGAYTFGREEERREPGAHNL
jgi:hypothetical protein